MNAVTERGSTRRSMLLLALGVAVISLQDPIIKSLMGGYPVHEAIVIRSVAALPIFAVLVWRLGGWRTLREGRPGALIVRGLILVVSYTTYYLAFPAMPLANVVALYFTAPLFVVALSRPMLGEHQGLGRWLAVTIGFIGALIVAQPIGGAIGWSALLPITAAAFYAFAQILARRWGNAASATIMSFHQNAVYLVVALLFAAITAPLVSETTGSGSLNFLLRPWVLPTAHDLLLLALCGPIAVGATILLTKAYREAPPGAVTSLEYTMLIWATFWGFVVFGEVPNAATIVGAVVIIASGLYAMTRASPARIPAP